MAKYGDWVKLFSCTKWVRMIIIDERKITLLCSFARKINWARHVRSYVCYGDALILQLLLCPTVSLDLALPSRRLVSAARARSQHSQNATTTPTVSVSPPKLCPSCANVSRLHNDCVSCTIIWACTTQNMLQHESLCQAITCSKRRLILRPSFKLRCLWKVKLQIKPSV